MIGREHRADSREKHGKLAKLAPLRLGLSPFVDNEREREKIEESEAAAPRRPVLGCAVTEIDDEPS